MNGYSIFAWLCVIEFFIKQNTYYGWNARPQSDGELIADGITLALAALAILITAVTKDQT